MNVAEPDGIETESLQQCHKVFRDRLKMLNCFALEDGRSYIIKLVKLRKNSKPDTFLYLNVR